MNLKIWRYFIASSVVMTFASCGPETPATDSSEDVVAEEAGEQLENAGENVVYYGTPSLVEVATMMKNSGATFSNSILHDASKSGNYATQNKKALNLGVYGADLTYSAMFEETQESINYLKTVKALAEDMGLTGAFETEFLQSIEKNITNRDSLLDVITDFYWSADAYLMDNQRSEVASLIIIGGWVESMYIACHMAKSSPKNLEIKNRIGEQKLVLKNLLLFVSSLNSSDEEVKRIAEQLKSVQTIYNEVELSHSEVEAMTDSEKGETVIGSETEVIIEPKHLEMLSEKFGEIRSSFIE